MKDRLPLVVMIFSAFAALVVGTRNGFPFLALGLYVVGVAAAWHWLTRKATTAIRGRRHRT